MVCRGQRACELVYARANKERLCVKILAPLAEVIARQTSVSLVFMARQQVFAHINMNAPRRVKWLPATTARKPWVGRATQPRLGTPWVLFTCLFISLASALA